MSAPYGTTDNLNYMTDTFTYWYVRPDGSFEVACSESCFDKWCESGLVSGRPTRWPSGLFPVAFESLCVSCSVSDSLVHEPEMCLVHVGCCEQPTWILGIDAVEFVDSIGESGGITGCTWEAAKHLANSHPELSGEEVAAKVAKRW